MKKIVNGQEVDMSTEEVASMQQEWQDQQPKDEALMEKYRKEQEAYDKIGKPHDFLLNLCKFLDVEPETIRDWKEGDQTYKSFLDIDIGLF